MDKFIYWLDNVPHLGTGTKKRLMETFNTGEGIYQAKEKYLQCILDNKKLTALRESKAAWDVDKKYAELKEKKIQMVTLLENHFPMNLCNIPDPPFCLYYRGKLPDERYPSVAVIGARQCSEYGRYIAQELGKCLGENRIQVISGMATGIDGISQSAALEAGGTSYGVLGCGVDICYPKSNQKLYDQLIESGCIISSYPLGTQPLRQLFPPRNRIVSGLADVLVVIEARQKSGTSITVEMALEQGKDIYAVPGRITDRLSDGCNKMLREGAHVFLSPQDFLQELQQLLPEKMVFSKSARQNELTYHTEEVDEIVKEKEQGSIRGEREQILAVLDFYPQYIDTIAEKLEQVYGLKMSVLKLNTVLMEMCLFDDVKQEGAGWFSKNSL